MHAPLYCSLVIAIAVLLTGACTSVEDSDTSPLATWNPSNDDIFNDATTGEVTLDISAACVRLIQNQKTI